MEKKQCPIDQTELTAFNQYELQDGTICRSCAKKIGLIDGEHNTQLAKAAKTLLTINVAKNYVDNNQTVDSQGLLDAYKNELNSTKNNSDSPNDAETTIKPNESGKDTSSSEKNGSKNLDSDKDNSIADTTADKPVKKEPIFWKGDGIKGFVYGAFAGLAIGMLNMAFLNFGHLGIISWLVIWLFIGANPYFKDTRSPEQIAKDVDSQKEAAKERAAKRARSKPETIITNNTTSPKKKRPIFGGLVCPRCHSANVQLVSDTANIKATKTKTHVNADLNPLHPFRIANVKKDTKAIKKHSKAKTTAAILTAGASTIVTGGTRSNKSHEYHCQDCGKIFYKK
ncbi:hypothetical protein [Lactiplantibacillus paraxiangfangensis]|uniref:hypothetical protein n=1 Tax=Lactiplantibacillus paraxiangfangensis TaxID=3076224 RepID=UPI0030C76B87